MAFLLVVFVGIIPVLVLRYYIIKKRLGCLVSGLIGFAFALIAMVIFQVLELNPILATNAAGLIGAFSILFFYAKWFDFSDEHANHNKSGASSSQVTDLTKKAYERFKDGDLKESEKLYVKALAEDWDNPDLHFKLANLYSVLKDKDNSLYHLDKAIEHGLEIKKIKKKNTYLEWIKNQPDYTTFLNNIAKRQKANNLN